MTFPMFSAENVTLDRRLSVIQLASEGSELLLGIMEHCLEIKNIQKFGFL